MVKVPSCCDRCDTFLFLLASLSLSKTLVPSQAIEPLISTGNNKTRSQVTIHSEPRRRGKPTTTSHSLDCSDAAGVATSVAADGSNYSAVKTFPQEKGGGTKKRKGPSVLTAAAAGRNHSASDVRPEKHPGGGSRLSRSASRMLITAEDGREGEG